MMIVHWDGIAVIVVCFQGKLDGHMGADVSGVQGRGGPH